MGALRRHNGHLEEGFEIPEQVLSPDLRTERISLEGKLAELIGDNIRETINQKRRFISLSYCPSEKTIYGITMDVSGGYNENSYSLEDAGVAAVNKNTVYVVVN